MRSVFIRFPWIAGALVSLLIHPQMSRAQSTGGAASLQIEPSVRASGMGRASGAVFWDLGPDAWANPALLGYERGLRFEHTRVRLLPGLASDVFYTADRVTLGAYGLGILLVGRPVSGFGRTWLDYGSSEWVSNTGSPLGTFNSWEQAQIAGVGISLSELVTELSGSQRASVRRFTRFGDVALGYTAKRVEIQLAPTWVMPHASGTGHAHDRGILLRLTPYNSIDSLGWLPALDRLLDPAFGGARLDLSWGWSDLNGGNERIVFMSSDNSDPLPHAGRRSVALHLAMGFPGIFRHALRTQGLGLLARSLTPLLSWGMVWDRNWSKVYSDELPIYNKGWELTLGNIFTWRRGHIKDVAGDIIDDTSGDGLGFHLGDLGGFRYDWATVPQARELPRRVHYKGWTVQIDPLAVWRHLHLKTPLG